ncbi:hypothetical protein TNCV_459831 [Trichonephila clavipes]|nr:hypothetical protein TNCV_459831 [Trichonephila clavipes]
MFYHVGSTKEDSERVFLNRCLVSIPSHTVAGSRRLGKSQRLTSLQDFLPRKSRSYYKSHKGRNGFYLKKAESFVEAKQRRKENILSSGDATKEQDVLRGAGITKQTERI